MTVGLVGASSSDEEESDDDSSSDSSCGLFVVGQCCCWVRRDIILSRYIYIAINDEIQKHIIRSCKQSNLLTPSAIACRP